MLDDFRQQANTSSFDDDQNPYLEPERMIQREFLGMTAFQRFIISLMLLFLTILIGGILLLVTERIVVPLS